MTRAGQGQAFAALLPALRPEWRSMTWTFAVGTISALALGAITVLSAWAVGHAVVERTVPGPLWWAVISVLVLGRCLLTWQEMDVSHALAYRILERLRSALFDVYARSVPGRTREHSGRAAAVVMDDIEHLEFFYAHTVAQLATAFTVFAVSFGTALVLLPEAGLVMLGGGAVIAASAALSARSIRRIGAQEQEARNTLSTTIVDALGALREVLAYGMRERVIDGALEMTHRATELARRRQLRVQWVAAVRDVSMTAVVIGVISVSAFASGALGASDSVAFSPAALPALVAVALVGLSAMTDATTTITQLHPLAASAERVAHSLERPAVVAPPSAPVGLPDGPLGIRFSDVFFGYIDCVAVVSKCSMHIAAGEHVGIAGPSGSGKSTLLTLAARLWDPDAGCIELLSPDGTAVPLDRIDDDLLRRTVALVDQETTVFPGTVRENLLRGSDPHADHVLRAVLSSVGTQDWLDLDTELGQGGTRLSGGQLARLCLARALVRKPRSTRSPRVSTRRPSGPSHACLPTSTAPWSSRLTVRKRWQRSIGWCTCQTSRASALVTFLVPSPQFEISRIGCRAIPRRLEDARGFGLHRILSVARLLGPAVRTALPLLIVGHRPVVLLAPAVVGVPPGPGVPHLQEFARHIGADEIFIVEVLLEEPPDLLARGPRDLRVLEAPVGQDLRLVRLDLQHALLAAADTIEVGPLAKIDRREVERVIKLLHGAPLDRLGPMRRRTP